MSQAAVGALTHTDDEIVLGFASLVGSVTTAAVANVVTAGFAIALFVLLKKAYPAFYAPLQRRGLGQGASNFPLPVSGDLALAPLIRAVLRVPKDDLIDHAGTDAYFFLRFMRFGVQLFALMRCVAFLQTVILHLLTEKMAAGLLFFL
jgi:hypothetical protein